MDATSGGLRNSTSERFELELKQKRRNKDCVYEEASFGDSANGG